MNPMNAGSSTPNLVWIERRDSTIVEERPDPRAASAGHVRETPWDRLHLTYFLGYAVWNYLTTPLLFAQEGSRVVISRCRSRRRWGVLEVTYPDDVPAHTKVQKLYFGDDFMLDGSTTSPTCSAASQRTTAMTT